MDREEQNRQTWLKHVRSVYPDMSEDTADIVRGSAAIQWAEQAGDPKLIKLYEQYLILNRLLQG